MSTLRCRASGWLARLSRALVPVQLFQGAEMLDQYLGVVQGLIFLSILGLIAISFMPEGRK